MFRILLLHKRFDLLLVLGSVVMSQASLLYCGLWVGKWDAHRYKDSTLSSHCKCKANPGQAVRVPRGWVSHISGPSAHEGVRGCQPYAPATFTSRRAICLLLISITVCVVPRDIVQLEGSSQWQIPMTSSRIEPATFRFVAHCIIQLHHC
jgi:hypothetical protein